MNTATRNTYGTEVSATYVGKRIEPPLIPGEKGWSHHRWEVTLTREGQTMDLPFKMGLGHEQTKCGKPKPMTLGRYGAPIPCDHYRCNNAGWQPTPPSLYDVLTSLKADDTQGRSFAEWCGDYGYDVDSRKAMETYLACQESTDKSVRFFRGDWQRIVEDEEYQ